MALSPTWELRCSGTADIGIVGIAVLLCVLCVLCVEQVFSTTEDTEGTEEMSAPRARDKVRKHGGLRYWCAGRMSALPSLPQHDQNIPPPAFTPPEKAKGGRFGRPCPSPEY